MITVPRPPYDECCGLVCERKPRLLRINHDQVYDFDITSDDLQTTCQPQRKSSNKEEGLRRSSAMSALKYKQIDTNALVGQTLGLQDWLNRRSVKIIQEKCDLEAREASKLYEPVLERELTVAKPIGDFLEYKKMTDLRKKEVLHKDWQGRVFNPIRRQVAMEMHLPEAHEMRRRKVELYKEYLEHVNKKCGDRLKRASTNFEREAHVFLDTIDPSEYYPLGLHSIRSVTAHTKRFRDPLLIQERKKLDEDRCILRCITGSTLTDNEVKKVQEPNPPLIPMGRHGTENKTWIRMPLTNIESPQRLASRNRMMRGKRNMSTLPLQPQITFQIRKPSGVILHRSRTMPDLKVKGQDESEAKPKDESEAKAEGQSNAEEKVVT